MIFPLRLSFLLLPYNNIPAGNLGGIDKKKKKRSEKKKPEEVQTPRLSKFGGGGCTINQSIPPIMPNHNLHKRIKKV